MILQLHDFFSSHVSVSSLYISIILLGWEAGATSMRRLTVTFLLDFSFCMAEPARMDVVIKICLLWFGSFCAMSLLLCMNNDSDNPEKEFFGGCEESVLEVLHLLHF